MARTIVARIARIRNVNLFNRKFLGSCMWENMSILDNMVVADSCMRRMDMLHHFLSAAVYKIMSYRIYDTSRLLAAVPSSSVAHLTFSSRGLLHYTL